MPVRHLAMSLVLMLAAEGPALGQSLSEGLQAYRQNRIADARRIYESVVASASASPDDKATAAQEMGRLTWLVDRDAPRALEHLSAAQRIGARGCATGLLTARILRESGQSAQSLDRGPALIERCDDPSKRDEIRLQLIQASLQLAESDPGQQLAHLGRAETLLRLLGPDSAASLEGSRNRLELALLTNEPEAALDSWRSYFWLVDRDSPQALSAFNSAELFRSGLSPEATTEARVALADLLMRAGFFQPLRRFVAVNQLAQRAEGMPAWRRISSYIEQRERLDSLMLEINRQMAVSGRDSAALDQIQARLEGEMRSIGGALLAGAGVTEPPASTEAFLAALLQHYGMFGTGPGRTSGYPSLHYGHVVGDRGAAAALYGHHTDVRFVELDNMIANGFESWLWDGSAATGGWASGTTIVGVRTGYASSPIGAYTLIGDGPVRRRLIADQARLAAEDLAQLRTRPVTYLRGLGDRLRLQAIDRVAAVARARMGQGADLRRAFLDEWYRTDWQRSFDFHEARHILDGTLHVDDSADSVPATGLEFRAKLTEIAMTDYPRLALWAINDSNMGDGSGHGQANYRVMDLFRSWIQTHPEEVMGFDPALPPLAQLDKLTDDQMRSIARSADPLAQVGAAPARQP